MIKSIKTIMAAAVISFLAAGSIFAQTLSVEPNVRLMTPKKVVIVEEEEEEPEEISIPEENHRGFQFANKRQSLIGTVALKSTSDFTVTDLDGKKTKVYVTPFTDIIDFTKSRTGDTILVTYTSLKTSDWVRIKYFVTEGGKVVADSIEVYHVAKNSSSSTGREK